MNSVKLPSKRRATGKQNVKKVRKEGNVPGIYYIKNSENIPISADPKALKDIVYTKETKMVELSIEGENKIYDCFLKDVTFDPITSKVTHFDLLGVLPEQKISVEIPISLIGTPIGVRQSGGILQHNLRKISISCLPKDLPNAIEVDVTNLNLGQSIQLKQIAQPQYEFFISEESVIAHVTASRLTAKAGEEKGKK